MHRWDDVPAASMPVFATVPGGSKDTRDYRFKADFDKGLYAYEKARKDGLEPESTTLGGVERAKEQVQSHKRGLEKLKKMGVETDIVKTAPGVER